MQDDIRTSQEKAELETLKRYKKNYVADFALEARGRMHLLHQEELRLMQAQAAADPNTTTSRRTLTGPSVPERGGGVLTRT